jgi:exodeoxyribonuclease-3
MKFISFNVNGVRARIEQLQDLISKESPDILCLQEIKCVTEQFPYEAFGGMQCYVNGQKGYNGVSICSVSEIKTLDVFPEVESRTLGAIIDDTLLINVYAPHGDVREAPRFFQKLQWFDHFAKVLHDLLKFYPKMLLMGDFNVAAEDIDVWDPILLKDTIGTYAEERESFRKLIRAGLLDAFRLLYPNDIHYTWWDYKEGRAWKNQGMRIDYVLVSEALKDFVKDVYVLEEFRKRRRPTPSDHAPLVCIIE